MADDPVYNLAAAVLVQAERDYHYGWRRDVGLFLISDWFETICETLDYDIKKTALAIREGHGMCSGDGRRIGNAAL